MMLRGTLRLSQCWVEMWGRLNFFKPSSFKMGGERINCGAETDGKKGSLCKLQSNFNRSDKMLPRSVWFCLDSAAANTFICNWQGDLEACIRLYFLSGELVVTKFPRAQGWTAQGTAVGWFWVESFLPLCAPFQSLGAAASPLSVTHGGPDFKKRGKKNPTQIQNNPTHKSSHRPAPSMASHFAVALGCSSSGHPNSCPSCSTDLAQPAYREQNSWTPDFPAHSEPIMVRAQRRLQPFEDRPSC